MKTEFHFRSTAFNCTDPKEYFINDCCFGGDVCRWLIERLRAQRFQTGTEPLQEDFGWFFTFTAGGTEHCVIISFQPNDPANGDRWLGWIERQTGFFSSIFGGRKRGISPEAVEAIDTALRSSSEIQDLSWDEYGAGG